jgi:hypothetical protein
VIVCELQAHTRRTRREGWSGRLGFVSKQGLDVADRLGLQQNVSADGADIGRDLIDDDDPVPVPHGVGNLAGLVLSGASLDAALHDRRPLWI